ncbi:hypothetical protein C8R45DRAFT_927755 [Mycena sanguinolenta]|nr:hypothetical protein C8R45DRAFT_927755 [Mycena sanguinolenta]
MAWPRIEQGIHSTAAGKSYGVRISGGDAGLSGLHKLHIGEESRLDQGRRRGKKCGSVRGHVGGRGTVIGRGIYSHSIWERRWKAGIPEVNCVEPRFVGISQMMKSGADRLVIGREKKKASELFPSRTRFLLGHMENGDGYGVWISVGVAGLIGWVGGGICGFLFLWQWESGGRWPGLPRQVQVEGELWC